MSSNGAPLLLFCYWCLVLLPPLPFDKVRPDQRFHICCSTITENSSKENRYRSTAQALYPYDFIRLTWIDPRGKGRGKTIPVSEANAYVLDKGTAICYGKFLHWPT